MPVNDTDRTETMVALRATKQAVNVARDVDAPKDKLEPYVVPAEWIYLQQQAQAMREAQQAMQEAQEANFPPPCVPTGRRIKSTPMPPGVRMIFLILALIVFLMVYFCILR